MFFVKKINLSTLSMERADLLAGTMSPAVENTLPLETKVADTASERLG